MNAAKRGGQIAVKPNGVGQAGISGDPCIELACECDSNQRCEQYANHRRPQSRAPVVPAWARPVMGLISSGFNSTSSAAVTPI